jgi:GIY-YIG catalytic domain-containing protein/NUMOD3 motif-containing protein
MFVYKIENTVNGKVYIGKTIMRSVKDRWKTHRRTLRLGNHRNPHLQHAYDLYGSGSFSYSILEIHADREAVGDAETTNIIRYKSANPDYGYNMSFGGEGVIFTDEVKEKMRAAWAKRNAAGLPGPFAGKTHSDESKRKAAISCTGWKHTPEALAKISKAKKGKPAFPGAIAKMAAANKGNTYNLGKKRSAESIQRMSDSRKGHFAHNKGVKYSEEKKSIIAAKVRATRARNKLLRESNE